MSVPPYLHFGFGGMWIWAWIWVTRQSAETAKHSKENAENEIARSMWRERGSLKATGRADLFAVFKSKKSIQQNNHIHVYGRSEAVLEIT